MASGVPLYGDSRTPLAEVAPGRWVPAIPVKAPIDVRWVCEHEWTPHVHPGTGWTSYVDYDCVRCGAETEAGIAVDGPWPVRRWIALRLFPSGRKVRHAEQ